MPKGVYERKPKGVMTQSIEDQAKPDLFPVRLLKNYHPIGDYEVVGYHQKEKAVKDAAGNRIIVQQSAFIEGQIAPAPFPGVGFETKVWADTVLKLPLQEARRLVDRNLAVRADALPG